jgi:hypothetical protein
MKSSGSDSLFHRRIVTDEDPAVVEFIGDTLRARAGVPRPSYAAMTRRTHDLLRGWAPSAARRLSGTALTALPRHAWGVGRHGNWTVPSGVVGSADSGDGHDAHLRGGRLLHVQLVSASQGSAVRLATIPSKSIRCAAENKSLARSSNTGSGQCWSPTQPAVEPASAWSAATLADPSRSPIGHRRPRSGGCLCQPQWQRSSTV